MAILCKGLWHRDPQTSHGTCRNTALPVKDASWSVQVGYICSQVKPLNLCDTNLEKNEMCIAFPYRARRQDHGSRGGEAGKEHLLSYLARASLPRGLQCGTRVSTYKPACTESRNGSRQWAVHSHLPFLTMKHLKYMLRRVLVSFFHYLHRVLWNST